LALHWAAAPLPALPREGFMAKLDLERVRELVESGHDVNAFDK
jgi:hypothetical protein